MACDETCWLAIYDVFINTLIGLITVISIFFIFTFITSILWCMIKRFVSFKQSTAQRIQEMNDDQRIADMFDQDEHDRKDHVRRELEMPDEDEYEKRRKVIPKEEVCIVCLDYRKCVKFFPCMHVNCCRKCANVIIEREKEGKCPLCREKIIDFEVLEEKVEMDKKLLSKMISTDEAEKIVENYVDKSYLNALRNIGYTKIRALKSLKNTNNQSVERAIDWIDKHSNDPNLDKPIEMYDTDEIYKNAKRNTTQVIGNVNNNNNNNNPNRNNQNKFQPIRVSDFVNEVFLSSLISMGYDKKKSENALIKTKNKSISDAIDWMNQN